MAIWRKLISATLGEDVLGDLEKSFGDFGENMLGDNVEDLEKHGRRGYGDFKLEFAME